MAKKNSSLAEEYGQKKFSELTIKDLVILEFFKAAIEKSKNGLSNEEIQNLLVRCSQLTDHYLEHCCIFKEPKAP